LIDESREPCLAWPALPLLGEAMKFSNFQMAVRLAINFNQIVEQARNNAFSADTEQVARLLRGQTSGNFSSTRKVARRDEQTFCKSLALCLCLFDFNVEIKREVYARSLPPDEGVFA
jgi:hypothetical protein